MKDRRIAIWIDALMPRVEKSEKLTCALFHRESGEFQAQGEMTEEVLGEINEQLCGTGNRWVRMDREDA
jgi:hypothetical protein